MSAEGSRRTNESNNVPTADNNANVDQSKGAIPKTKPTTKVTAECSSRKHLKLNNNVEDAAPVVNGTVSAAKINGYAKNLSESGGLRDRHEKFTVENSCNELNGVPNLADCDLANSLDSYLALQEGPSSYRKARLKLDYDSSSDENELLSVSDDGCIYTYKGDHEADLPSSFFSLDVPFVENAEQSDHPERNSSPEMDFLEMDFDPGPSGDADSDSNSNAELNNVDNLPEDAKGNILEPPCGSKCENKAKTVDVKSKADECSLPPDFATPGTSSSNNNSQIRECTTPNSVKNEPASGSTLQETRSSPSCRSTGAENRSTRLTNDHIKMPWSCLISHRTTSSHLPRLNKRYHCTTGELVSPGEKDSSPVNEFTATSPLYRPVLESDTKIMVWTEQEALVKQITQIGASACGATAVLNVLTALRFPVPSIDKIQEAVVTQLRCNSSPLTEYLLSRSVAGSTHEDLISGLQSISGGQIYARFFPMYPERIVNLYMWLGFWIQNGAVPIATLNLQKCTGVLPDAWHHQMIFGVAPDRVYLANPLEVVDSGQLWPQMCSESVLLIRREDVLSRWNIKTDLKRLMAIPDFRWRRINVVGQVANMVRESMREFRPGFTNTSHIRIPASYSSGVTLAINVNSPACSLLSQCPDLPLLHPSDTVTALYNNRSGRISK